VSSRYEQEACNPFSLIEMQVNKDGEGEGKLAVAARLTLNDNVLVMRTMRISRCY